MSAPPLLSVVVPALDEAAALPALLDRLATALAVPHEVVVADGGSVDDTRAVAEARGAVVVDAPRGRGVQLRAGAAAARADVLLFLHADALPSAAALALCAARARAPRGRPATHEAGAFRLRIDATGAAYRMVERGANLRSRVLGLPYGDQGLLVTRAHYDAAGGFPAWPLMEDVALVRALRRTGRVRLLPADVGVSARRWQRDGVVRRMLGNWLLLARFLLGARPETLAAEYHKGSV